MTFPAHVNLQTLTYFAQDGKMMVNSSLFWFVRINRLQGLKDIKLSL